MFSKAFGLLCMQMFVHVSTIQQQRVGCHCNNIANPDLPSFNERFSKSKGLRFCFGAKSPGAKHAESRRAEILPQDHLLMRKDQYIRGCCPGSDKICRGDHKAYPLRKRKNNDLLRLQRHETEMIDLAPSS